MATPGTSKKARLSIGFGRLWCVATARNVSQKERSVVPVQVRARQGKYRLVDENNRIAKNKKGEAADSGGFADTEGAEKRAKAINANERRKSGGTDVVDRP